MGVTVIKRYANRKLYNTEQSSYVTLEEIGEMVKAGEEVKIVDKRSGEDLTRVTLAQIIYEDQKKSSQSIGLPLNALRNIIESGGEMLAKLGTPVTRMSDDIKRRAEKLDEGRQLALRDFIEGAQRTMDDTQRRFDDGVRGLLDQLTHVAQLREEVARQRKTITQLESRIRMLDRQLEMLVESARQEGVKRSLPGQKSKPALRL